MTYFLNISLLLFINKYNNYSLFYPQNTKKVEITLFAFSAPHKIDPLSLPPKKSQVHMDLPEMPRLFHFLLICLKQAAAAAVNV